MKQTLTVAMLLFAAPLTLAQEAEPSKPSRSGRHVPAIVTMEFGGGTLEKFVGAVRQREAKANIVLANNARAVMVPPMVLNMAGLEQALEAACMATDGDYEVRVKEFRGMGEPVFSITAIKRRSRSTSVTKPGGNPAQAKSKPRDQFQRVFSLNSLTAKSPYDVKPLSVTTILSAIELAMSDEVKAPRIRYHNDSGLVLVRGTNDQLHSVMEILEVLKQDVRERERNAANAHQMKRRSSKMTNPASNKKDN